ncbi:MAG: hypothetical protein H0X33_11720 [Taibaiella sp.]|nr:hypothetical protein [Taibaiella sp.]
MKRLFVIYILLLLAGNAYAQTDLFGPQAADPVTHTNVRKGWLFGVNGALLTSGADMAKRFGYGYTVGPMVEYKTAKNWIFGVKFDFLFGNQVKEDSLMTNIADKNGNMIGADGVRTRPVVVERGYMVGLEAGKLLSISRNNKDKGILLLTSVGFIQHKILIIDKNKTIPAIRGDYAKGYDRLTNGLFVEQYAGYMHLSKNSLLNFHIGLDLLAGFTQGRRSYLYDVMRPDNKQRVDLLFGVRGGWYIPVFKRKSEELVF